MKITYEILCFQSYEHSELSNRLDPGFPDWLLIDLFSNLFCKEASSILFHFLAIL